MTSGQGAEAFEFRNAPVLKLDTLLRLRWLAIVGQAVAVLTVRFLLGFPVPLVAMFLVIGLAAALNLAVKAQYPTSHRIEPDAATWLFAIDILQLAALLFMSGGLENPFAFLFLAPVMISATTLSPIRTIGLGLLCLAAATLLAFWHLPLPWHVGLALELPSMYLLGVWMALALGIGFIGAYAWRVADEARQLAGALAATEFVLAREQHLSQLDGLAAAAAHQLGTPLGTIAVVAREIDRDLPDDHPLKDDVQLLLDQAARCRDILSKISSLNEEEQGPLGTLSLTQLLAEAAEPCRHFGIAIVLEPESADGSAEPSCPRNAGVIHGIGNLIENAVDFATGRVVIRARWTRGFVDVAVRDDGPGFAPGVLERFGEPYLSRRPAKDGESARKGGGLGLGLFIAKTLLERSGAQVLAANVAGGGAEITLRWPRNLFEGKMRIPVAELA